MAIPLESFNIADVSFGDPEKDRLNNVNVPFVYERNGKTGPITFNLPLVRTDNNGVTTFANENGGGSHSIKIMFPRNEPVFIVDYDEEGNEIGGHYEEPEWVRLVPRDPNDPNSDTIKIPAVEGEEGAVINDYPEAQAYADILDQIYQKYVDYCFNNKTKLGFTNIKQRLMVEAQIKAPIYRHMTEAKDDEEEKEDMRHAPSVYAKFIESGAKAAEPNKVYTSFIGLDKKPIHWRSLENTMMYIIATIRVERGFLGAKKNIQVKVTKAIVVETRPREEMSNDMQAAQDLLTNNPALLQAFLKNLDKLSTYREVIREGDVIKKGKNPIQIKGKQLPEEIHGKEEEETNDSDEEETQPPKGKGADTSPLDTYMKQQEENKTPATPTKRVIPKRSAVVPATRNK